MRSFLKLNRTPRRSLVLRLAILASLVLLPLSATAEDKPRTLTISFGPSAVTVSGVESQHQVIAFGIGIGTHGHAALLRRDIKTAADNDGDGTVTFSIRNLPTRSVWIAVDANSGLYTVATPSGEPLGTLSLPANIWRGDQAQVDITTKYVEALVVRPGPHPGAWALRSADGGSNDADGVSDRKVRIRLEKMEKVLGEDKGPPHAIPKDLLFAVDPQTLDLFVSEAK